MLKNIETRGKTTKSDTNMTTTTKSGDKKGHGLGFVHCFMSLFYFFVCR